MEVCNFGLPEDIVSDRGLQFVSWVPSSSSWVWLWVSPLYITPKATGKWRERSRRMDDFSGSSTHRAPSSSQLLASHPFTVSKCLHLGSTNFSVSESGIDNTRISHNTRTRPYSSTHPHFRLTRILITCTCSHSLGLLYSHQSPHILCLVLLLTTVCMDLADHLPALWIPTIVDSYHPTIIVILIFLVSTSITSSYLKITKRQSIKS